MCSHRKSHFDIAYIFERCGVVDDNVRRLGIYVHSSLSNMGLLDGTDIVLDRDCVKCEVESRKFVC